MTNKWNIPDWLENNVRKRDKTCVYCNQEFRNNPKDKATWEHIDNNENNLSEKNIALCCASCNASKGIKTLKKWLSSNYCKSKGINKDSISVKKVI